MILQGDPSFFNRVLQGLAGANNPGGLLHFFLARDRLKQQQKTLKEEEKQTDLLIQIETQKAAEQEAEQRTQEQSELLTAALRGGLGDASVSNQAALKTAEPQAAASLAQRTEERAFQRDKARTEQVVNKEEKKLRNSLKQIYADRPELGERVFELLTNKAIPNETTRFRFLKEIDPTLEKTELERLQIESQKLLIETRRLNLDIARDEYTKLLKDKEVSAQLETALVQLGTSSREFGIEQGIDAQVFKTLGKVSGDSLQEYEEGVDLMANRVAGPLGISVERVMATARKLSPQEAQLAAQVFAGGSTPDQLIASLRENNLLPGMARVRLNLRGQALELEKEELDTFIGERMDQEVRVVEEAIKLAFRDSFLRTAGFEGVEPTSLEQATAAPAPPPPPPPEDLEDIPATQLSDEEISEEVDSTEDKIKELNKEIREIRGSTATTREGGRSIPALNPEGIARLKEIKEDIKELKKRRKELRGERVIRRRGALGL